MGNLKTKKIVIYFICLVTTCLGYQNCGPGMKANIDGLGSLSFNSLTCDPSLDPSEAPLLRLSKTEYFNSVSDLLRKGQATALITDVESSVNLVPTDNLGVFTNMDATISQAHINGYYQISKIISDYFENNNSALQTFVNSYAGCTNFNDSCLNTFIQNFGLNTFRRPLTASEVQRFSSALASNDASGFREVIFVFLQSPQFLLHLETEGVAIAGNEQALQLSAYELASRLSFTFLRTTPDDYLLDLARTSAILSPQGKLDAVNYILNGPKRNLAQETFKDFYSQWLKTRSFSDFQFNPSSTRYDAFLEGAQPNIDDMIDEVETMVDHYTWQEEGSLSDLLLSPFSFTSSQSLANIYGVQPWNGDTNQKVRMPANERSGLLTRSFFLVSPNEETHPIHRSVFIRRQILCETISPPPDTLPPDALAPPEHDPSLTTRERFEQKTSSASCMGCHSTINPVGFAFENYDGIGRYRQFEKVFETDGSFNQLPLNTQVEPRIDFQSDRQVAGSIELNQLIVESGKADACFAKQFWRYSHKRVETRSDHCSVLKMAQASNRPGGSILEALKELVNTKSFTHRYWNNEGAQ